MPVGVLYALALMCFIAGTSFGPLPFWLTLPVMVGCFLYIHRHVRSER